MSELTVTALTAFLGSEGMWQEGDTKAVPAARAQELQAEGLVQARPDSPDKPGSSRETKPALVPVPSPDLTTAIITPAAPKGRVIETK